MTDDSTDRMIGILGGLGPAATLDLYRHIIELTPAARDQDHVRVLIYSNPKIPDRTSAIAGSGESPLPHLIQSAVLLEKSGAGVIAMPCNTSHYFLPRIQASVRIPVIDMVEETCRMLRSQMPHVKMAGLLATAGTLQSGIYKKALGQAGVSTLVPDGGDQEKIQAAIARVKAGSVDGATRDVFQSAGLRLMRSGAEAVILGCTEIPLAFDPEAVDYPAFNSTLILARAAVDWALGKR